VIKENKTSYIGIDLFAGVGGLSYGLMQAGFNIFLGIEINSIYAETLSKNHKKMKVIVDDIKKIDPLEALKETKLQNSDIDLIVGGPPCKGFSNSNKRTRNIDNPYNSLYKHFFRFIEIIKPKVYLLENVAGMKNLNNNQVFNDIIKISDKLGYFINWKIIDTSNIGVPQKRKRLIFIGTKIKANGILNFPASNIVTVKEALDDLPNLSNGNSVNEFYYKKNNDLTEYQKLMRKNSGNTVLNNKVSKNKEQVLERYKFIPKGGNWENIPKKLMLNYTNINNCHRWIYYRLKWNEPSVVISNFRKNMLIHPEQERGLSVREAARLQSFPDNFAFYGHLGSQQQQVANAVPPLLAKQIGENIIHYLEEAKDWKTL